jgi:hypothetical protein
MIYKEERVLKLEYRMYMSKIQSVDVNLVVFGNSSIL